MEAPKVVPPEVIPPSVADTAASGNVNWMHITFGVLIGFGLGYLAFSKTKVKTVGKSSGGGVIDATAITSETSEIVSNMTGKERISQVKEAALEKLKELKKRVDEFIEMKNLGYRVDGEKFRGASNEYQLMLAKVETLK